MTPFWISLRVVLLALIVVIPVGGWLGWVLARGRFRGLALLDALVLLPLALPPSVVGYGLLLLFGRHGPFGSLLEQLFGVRLVFSTAGAALAAAVVSLPLMAKGAEAAFARVDTRLEEQAAVQGMSPRRVFTWVSLPLAARGLGVAITLAAMRALGEFGATLTFAGYLPGVTNTASVEVYMAYQTGDDALALRLVICLAVIAQVAALVMAYAMRRTRSTA
jgi:molybdate transport system permease protein